ncbi:hypothetical protein S7335_1438 [Synechococcus sp. PCC 7335]|nr:hypothetical protein S7335_1438 [Synechococcus sp. PCC 7335]
MAEAAEGVSKEPNLHQLRIGALANRNKGYQSGKDTSVQTRRLEGMDRRNKGYDLKEGYSVQAQRLEGMDRRNKASLSSVSLIDQRQLVLDRSSSK